MAEVAAVAVYPVFRKSGPNGQKGRNQPADMDCARELMSRRQERGNNQNASHLWSQPVHTAMRTCSNTQLSS
jgi:hypothetical protein